MECHHPRGNKEVKRVVELLERPSSVGKSRPSRAMGRIGRGRVMGLPMGNRWEEKSEENTPRV